MSRWTLPLYTAEPNPTTDAMRVRLGGRVGRLGADSIGRRVRGGTESEPWVGWVLSEDEGHWFVWLGGTEVRRWAKEGAVVEDAAGDDARAAQLRGWALVEEQAEIEFQDRTGAWVAGFLVEKCRFGALVAREDGSIVASGFLAVRPPRASMH